jgi:hypothetical protein
MRGDSVGSNTKGNRSVLQQKKGSDFYFGMIAPLYRRDVTKIIAGLNIVNNK